MSTPPTDEQLAEIQERVDRAREGSIFAWRPTVDDLASLLAEVERLRTRATAVEKFCAARAEYITAINNCSPENSHDYWRWQGHAEGRRQLSQELKLPVAWPIEYKQAKQVTS